MFGRFSLNLPHEFTDLRSGNLSERFCTELGKNMDSKQPLPLVIGALFDAGGDFPERP